MGEPEKYSRFMNPCILHLNKLELELKCPSCLTLLFEPLLLPCNHVICSHCIPKMESDSRCPLCEMPYILQDLRLMFHLQNVVNIYEKMSAAFHMSDKQWSSSRCTNSNTADVVSQMDLMKKINGEKSGGMQKSLFLDNEPVQASVQPTKEVKAMERNVKTSELNNGKCKDGETRKRGLNLQAQSQPNTPPSFSGNKESDDDNNDGDSGYSANVFLTKTLEEEASKVSMQSSPKTVAHGEINKDKNKMKTQSKDYYVRESKKQKKQNNMSPVDIMKAPHVQSKSSALATDASVIDLEFEQYEKFNSTPRNASCVFCHSPSESQFSGPMIHYMNGNPIAADQANNSGVVHVHQKCVDWAPQVYFEGEIVKNLDAEISRASKIKCSVCGKKGAALGCYVKSCPKSFHVPCAVAIPECRWDCDEFLVLCPNHSSCRFPSEASKKVKKETITLSESSSDISSSAKQRAKNAWRASTDVTREWVICGSALSSAEKNLLANFAMLSGATISKNWAPNVTHLIASTDESGACDRTLKVLKAILNGKWILRFDWIKACMEAMQPVPEEPYEVTHDVHGCFDGPKNGRIRVTQKAPKLFSGMCFHFSSYFSPDFKYLEELTLAAGGTIVQRNETPALNDTNAKQDSLKNFFVYCLDPPEGCNLTEVADVIQKRAEEAEVFGVKSGNQVIGHTWLLDSIAACKLQPVDC